MNRAMRRALERQPMVQAVVTERREDGREVELPVGPRSNNRGIPEALCEQINRKVAEGKEKRWYNARVVRADNILKGEPA